MNINRNNYEAFLLDYFENNLSPEQVAELLIFLESNPDLNIDLEGFNLITVKPDPDIVFEDKASLKHEGVKPYSIINADNYEEYFVASIDGELGTEEEKDLEIFIGLNPELKREYELFSMTVLTSDPNVVYPAKAGLKKSSFGLVYTSQRTWLYSAVAVAASIALLIGIFFDFSPTTSVDQLAQHNATGNKIIQPSQNSQGITSEKPSVLNNNHDKPVNIPEHSSQPVTSTVNTAVNAGSSVASLVKPDVSSVTKIASTEILSVNISNSASSELAGIPRSYYQELYGYLQLREQREYQEYLEDRNARPWYAKALTEVKTLVAGPDEYDPKGIRRDNDIWMLAETGIKGFNYLTRSDIRLKRQLDEDGRTSAYAVASKSFEYSDKLEK